MATATIARGNTARASTVTVTPKPSTDGNSAATRTRGRSSATAGHARLAVEQAVQRHSVQVHMPILGEVTLPPVDELVFIGGILSLAVVGIMEWPVAIVLSAGHVLASHSHRTLIRTFGEVMEEA
jgi:hypothetical protein